VSNWEAIHVQKIGNFRQKDLDNWGLIERVVEVVDIIGNGIGHGVKAIGGKLQYPYVLLW